MLHHLQHKGVYISVISLGNVPHVYYMCDTICNTCVVFWCITYINHTHVIHV